MVIQLIVRVSVPDGSDDAAIRDYLAEVGNANERLANADYSIVYEK